MKKLVKVMILPVLMTAIVSGCMSAYIKSVGGDTEQVFNKIYLAEYPIAWEAAREALKPGLLEDENRENGTLQTKWIDNTSERNLIESAGSVSTYVKAQYRFRVTLAKGSVDGKSSVRITVQKEQQIQRDVLEGWRNQETDGIQENSLIYRVGKLIEFKLKNEKIENEKIKKQLDSSSVTN
jgi:hypothetical protein